MDLPLLTLNVLIAPYLSNEVWGIIQMVSALVIFFLCLWERSALLSNSSYWRNRKGNFWIILYNQTSIFLQAMLSLFIIVNGYDTMYVIGHIPVLIIMVVVAVALKKVGFFISYKKFPFMSEILL